MNKMLDNYAEQSRRFKYTEVMMILVLAGVFVFNISHFYWTYPAVSDPLQYLGPVAWKSTYAYWPWLDRLSIAIGLGITSYVFDNVVFAGIFYTATVTTLLFLIGMFWLRSMSGMWAVLIFAVLMNTSYLVLGWSTFIYPNQTVALYSLLSLICFFKYLRDSNSSKIIFLAGIFSAFAIFSKATGVAGALFIFGYIVWLRRWKSTLVYVAGGISGALLVLLIFVFIYNIESLENILHLFFKSSQLEGNAAWGNMVSFLDVILDMKYFPVFIALVLSVGAYKHAQARILFLYSWSFIGIIYFLYSFFPRGGGHIPHYIYSAYYFASIGLSIYLASSFSDKSHTSSSFYNYIAITLFALVLIGLYVGICYPVVAEYNFSYNYDYDLDIYNPQFHFNYPLSIRLLYTLGPLAIVALLALFEHKHSKKTAIALLLVVASVGSAMNAGLAVKKSEFDRYRAGLFYEAAPLLNEVPDKRFSIYVKEWNKHPQIDRLLWVYRQFFDTKYTRGSVYDSQIYNQREIERNILILEGEGDLLAIRGKQILTDSLEDISRYYSDIKIIKEIPWRNSMLFVVEVSARKEFSGDPVETVTVDDIDPTEVLSVKELSRLSPTISLGGIRGGFTFSRLADAENGFKIIAGETNNKGQHLLQLSLLSTTKVSLLKTNLVYLRALIRMPREANRAEIFLQDLKLEKDWQRVKTKLYPSGEWVEYVAIKKLRDDVSELAMGISWAPNGQKDIIEIKSIEVYVQD